MHHFIKIFGERNTSTNAVKTLIEQNSQSRILPSVISEIDASFPSLYRWFKRLRLPHSWLEHYINRQFRRAPLLHAWKHTAPDYLPLSTFDGCFVIFMIRHPASWITALYRRPYHQTGIKADNLCDFIQQAWPLQERDHLPKRALTPADLWTNKIQSYLSFQNILAQHGTPSRIYRFEDFACSQEGFYERLKPYLHQPNSDFAPLERSTKNADTDRNRAWYAKYYGENRWAEQLSPREIECLDQAIDWEFAAQFGYKPVHELINQQTVLTENP